MLVLVLMPQVLAQAQLLLHLVLAQPQLGQVLEQPQLGRVLELPQLGPVLEPLHRYNSYLMPTLVRSTCTIAYQ